AREGSCCAAAKHDGTGQRVVDPVCGMQVDPATSAHRARVDGKDFHFCSARCRVRFEADPGRYLAADGSKADVDVPAAPGTIFTCPMHPEVRQEGPGTCPKCGMALEPEMPSLDEEENPELRD